MSALEDAITEHRAAWQAFQDAPNDQADPETIEASEREAAATWSLCRCVPQSQEDIRLLRSHLDWWVAEESQRREAEPELFVLHALMTQSPKTAADHQAEAIDIQISDIDESISAIIDFAVGISCIASDLADQRNAAITRLAGTIKAEAMKIDGANHLIGQALRESEAANG